jgi:DDE superfamily endonuclease
VWFQDEAQDEAQVGQKNGITRRWARRGSRPSAPKDQRTASAYLFGATCPAEGKGAALVLPRCDTEAMSLHLAEIAAMTDTGAHAVVLLDQAGWHTARALAVPDNVTLIPLSPHAPELNPVENIWQFLRSCVTTGSRTACSLPMTTSPITAAMPGTASSNSPGKSCPSASAIGLIGPDQCASVLRRGIVRTEGVILARACALARLLHDFAVSAIPCVSDGTAAGKP